MTTDSPSATWSLLRRAAGPGPDGLIVSVDPKAAGWEYAERAVYRLEAGRRVLRAADGFEGVVLVLESSARVRFGATDLGVVGSRDSVFDGPPPPVILVEPGEPIELTAQTDALVALASAPAGPVSRTAVVMPDEIHVEHRGEGQTARRVHHLLPPAA